MRYQELSTEWPKWLPINQTVILRCEPENQFDAHAVGIYTYNGIKLGYVPGFYSMGIFSLLENGAKPNVRICYVNEKSTSHWWVKVVFESEIPTIETEMSKKLQSSAEVFI